MDPQVPQCSLQFWDVVWLLPLNLVIYEIPSILIRVEIVKIAMSVNDVYVLSFLVLSVLCALHVWQTQNKVTLKKYILKNQAIWPEYYQCVILWNNDTMTVTHSTNYSLQIW